MISPSGRPGGHLQALRDGILGYGKRMVAGETRRPRQPAEESPCRQGNIFRLAVNDPPRLYDLSPVRCPNGLVTQAHAQDGNRPARRWMISTLNAGLLGPTGPREMMMPAGFIAMIFVHRDLVVAEHLHVGVHQLPEVLVEVCVKES